MEFDEYITLDGVGMAEVIRLGKYPASEVVCAAIEALKRTNTLLSCMVETYDPDALILPDPSSAPFAGVPIVLKDAGGHSDGVLQEMGSRLLSGVRAKGETFTARRLKTAGFVVLGRATTAELTFGISAESSWSQPTRNPWDLSRTAGGSSAGSAAAVAAGAVPVAHGTDGGGSIRIPAAWCGLVGLKPSRGRVSWGPGLNEALFGMASEGVLTRSVRDSAALLDVLAGAEPGDPFRIAAPSSSYLSETTRPLGRLRVGLLESLHGAPSADGDIISVLDSVASDLTDAGHSIDPVSIDVDYEALLTAITQVWCSQLSVIVLQAAAATGRSPETHLEPATLTCHEYGQRLTAVDLNVATLVFNQLSRSVGQAMSGYDVLMTPSTAAPAPFIGALSPEQSVKDAVDWMRTISAPAPFSSVFNVCGNPAISLPLGETPSGLPVGIQFVAHHGSEDILFRLAGHFERARPWAHRRAGLIASRG